MNDIKKIRERRLEKLFIKFLKVSVKSFILLHIVTFLYSFKPQEVYAVWDIPDNSGKPKCAAQIIAGSCTAVKREGVPPCTSYNDKWYVPTVERSSDGPWCKCTCVLSDHQPDDPNNPEEPIPEEPEAPQEPEQPQPVEPIDPGDPNDPPGVPSNPSDPSNPGGPGEPPVDGKSALQEAASKILGYLIGIAFIFAALIAPYIGYLLASGDPIKIKKGREWMRALIQGLILLALSVTVVSIIGSDILQL